MISFNDTAAAFSGKTDTELRKSFWLFTLIGRPSLVKTGEWLTNTALALHLPLAWAIKPTIFSHFCGGETIDECDLVINKLGQHNIGTILDYSVEGMEKEAVFEQTANEIIKTIDKAEESKHIPFSVFKVTGVARFALLEKLSQTAADSLSDDEKEEYRKVKVRVNCICKAAYKAGIPVFIDAEESWVQPAIDQLADDMMALYNKEKAIVFNTIQLYRHDRLAFLKQSHQKAVENGYYLGLKLVRGAYMEKEAKRAAEMNYTNPIQPSKAASDTGYNAALAYCMAHIDRIAFCAGTHNEQSSLYLTELMAQYGLAPADPRVWFAQLLGMSDNISFNLSHAGYNVAKYVPYGPVREVLPYLIRRARENTSVAGQTSRELSLIQQEIERRKQKA